MQRLLYGIGALMALLIIIGLALPSTNRVEETTEIDAHPATVFALINDFRRVRHWTPWAQTDPNARFLFSGSNRGEGAIMTWNGAIIGSGKQVISISRPYEYVGIETNPEEPGAATSWFELSPGTGTTIVTWGFETDYGANLVARYFRSMLGSAVAHDYQVGLKRLKELAESLPGADFSDLDIEHIVVEPIDIAYLATTSRPEATAVAEAMRRAYFQILKFIDRHELFENGAPISVTRSFSGSVLAFDAAIPVRGLSDDTPRNGPDVMVGATYGGLVVRAKHVGSYRRLTDTHRKISAYLAALGISRNGAAWESYDSDPGDVAEDDLLTYVYYPISADQLFVN